MDQPAPRRITSGEPAAQLHQLRILLAEDNDTSRKLTIRILEKHGHTVLAVANGRAALAALDRECVDLILMDVQMPEMDGLAAAAAIRKRERTTGGHVPILALSAYAMPGDPERCLAAGMDGHVAKPLRAEQLLATISRHFAAAREKSATQRDRAATDQSAEPAFDPESVLADLDGDRELLLELILVFYAQADDLLATLREARDRGDETALERSAHKLKGSLGAFGARAAVDAALRLEIMGRNRDLADSEQCLVDLEREVQRLCEGLREFEESAATSES